MWKYNYDYLEHHGILGQKWGVRRFQNPDGSLTAEGRRRYVDISVDTERTMQKAKAVAKSSGVVTAAIAGIDIAALAAGSSSILLPFGPAAVLIGSGAAYVTAKLANQNANKKLRA